MKYKTKQSGVSDPPARSHISASYWFQRHGNQRNESLSCFLPKTPSASFFLTTTHATFLKKKKKDLNVSLCHSGEKGRQHCETKKVQALEEEEPSARLPVRLSEWMEGKTAAAETTLKKQTTAADNHIRP